MKKLIACSLAIFVFMSAAMPAQAGLFGPSKRELMQRMIDQQRESHGVQVLMYGEMKTQTELLRQIAGQNAQLSSQMQRAAVSPVAYQVPGHVPDRPPLQIPGNVPDLPPIQIPGNVPDRPSSQIRGNVPDAPGPILGTSRSNASFAKTRSPTVVKVVSKPTYYVNQKYVR